MEKALATQRLTSLSCFGNDLMLYTISEFLPGEYLLRVFPLICKAIQSRRVSLSLLGPPSSVTLEVRATRRSTLDLEGPVYGIYSTCRDLERIIVLDHSVTALKVEEAPETDSLTKMLPALHRYFSKLMKLEITTLFQTPVELLLKAVWHLPLTSITFTSSRLEQSTIECLRNGDLPAFAHTLRSLCTNKWSDNLLDALSPHCRRLQAIRSGQYHNEIMDNNPNLTSLTLFNSSSSITDNHPVVDLTHHTALVELSIVNGNGKHPLISRGTHTSLGYVLLHYCDPTYAIPFLQQCPAVKHVSLSCEWQNIVQIISFLDPTKCQQLTLATTSREEPSVEEVEKLILQRGFKINEEFLLCTRDAAQRWRRTVKLAPNIVHLSTLNTQGGRKDYLFRDPTYLASFSAISVITIDSAAFQWNQEMLKSLLKCATLKEVNLHCHHFKDPSGVELDSRTLGKLKLECGNGLSFTRLTLPNLTHLSLTVKSEESVLVGRLLDGDPLIQLPRLRVICINFSVEHRAPSGPIDCKAGHGSLTQLTIRGERTHISDVRLQNVPNLKKLELDGMATDAHVLLNVPGNCDILLRLSNQERTDRYVRHGYSSQSNLVMAICFDDNEERWVENMQDTEATAPKTITTEQLLRQLLLKDSGASKVL